ncbi:hypothetical protein Anas_01571 [Armadillidium nasatum]|uniref:Uncharacterized protein n=1 Tax=Armadillidium nasatum TaxID=96803 RepID=A0A5N5TDQ9_9CRUS|nr:hypothetical protein Anas_01571 [Armadillidium nasatum]
MNKIKKNRSEKDLLPESNKEATLEKVLKEECEHENEGNDSSCNTLSTTKDFSSSVSVDSSFTHCDKKSGKKPDGSLSDSAAGNMSAEAKERRRSPQSKQIEDEGGSGGLNKKSSSTSKLSDTDFSLV